MTNKTDENKGKYIGFRCTDDLYATIQYQMAVLGMTRTSDYVRIAIEEKIARDKYQFSENKGTYNHSSRFDHQLKYALISNKDIQAIIRDIVNKNNVGK